MKENLLVRIKKEFSYVIMRLMSEPNNQPNVQKVISCASSQVQFYANTPNTIIYYEVDGESGYFRECKKHVSPREFVWQLIEDYCKYVYVGANSKECERILKQKLAEKRNLNLFFHMGAGTSAYTRINRFRKTKDGSLIGINKPYPEWFEAQLLSLVQFAWGALDEYRYCKRNSGNQYHIYNSSRTITTKLVADMIGENNIIPESKYISLILDGIKRVGVSVNVASGISPDETEIEGVLPDFQRQSTILNMLDVICYQKDHRPGNYFVTIVDKCAKDICAFDNDCPSTLFASPSISFTTYIGCSPFVNKRGYINRPFLDKKSTVILLNTTKPQLYEIVSQTTSRIEREMMWLRIRRMKKTIKKSLRSNKTVLLDSDQWSEETIQTELEGDYGMTYLKYFYTRYIKADISQR